MKAKKIHHGDLIAEPGVVYDFDEITGYLDVTRADAKTRFDKLTTIGSYADFRGWTGSANKLTAIGGYADFSGWTGSANKTISTNDPSAVATCVSATFESFLKSGYYYADGILAKLVNRKGRVARVIIVGKTAVSYVVDDGNGNYSHGATLDEARNGLIYKLSSRDTTPFKAWKRTTTVTLAEAIQAYRAITGACEAGVRGFCERDGILPDKLTIADAINRTKGQYGADTFASFF